MTDDRNLSQASLTAQLNDADRAPTENERPSRPGLLPEAWRVEVPIFEGPLDLLLQLVKVNEVEITDIPVALICDQFHEYLGLMEELDLDIAGEYIYEAALLIQIKSRMLLPTLESTDGEEAGEDPREELVQRLLEYRRLKEAAQTLAEVDSVRRGLWRRRVEGEDLSAAEDEEMDLSEISLFDLLKAFRQVLDRYDLEHPDPLVFRGETFPVRGQIDRLLASLKPDRPLDLMDHLLALSCRSEAISAFLAVLELGRLNLVRLHQTNTGEVLIYRTTRELIAQELETIVG